MKPGVRDTLERGEHHVSTASVLTDQVTGVSREARLRPACQSLYPFLNSNRWESAAVLTDKVLAWNLNRRIGTVLARARVLDPMHFEFRDVPRQRRGLAI
jgi:hypothetical protein